MRRIILSILLVIILASVIYGTARWHPAVPKHEMKNKLYTGLCPYAGQCLVGEGPEFYENLNNQPDMYFTSTKPRCIADTQHILDYYCDNGVWSTRTKFVALRLIQFAKSNSISRNDFSVYCDKFDNALNAVSYSVANNQFTVSGMFSDTRCQNHPCFNHVCVLDYGGRTAIGLSLNSDIDDSADSILLAFDESATACNGVPSTASDFLRCGSTDFYYNPSLHSIIYSPQDAITPAAVNYANLQNAFFNPPFNAISNYVQNNTNLAFFNNTPLYNRVYYSEQATRKIFSFLELDQTDTFTNYFGVKYQGVSMGSNSCQNIFKPLELVDTSLDIYCQNDIVVGEKLLGYQGGQIDLWQDLVSKIRP